MSGNIHTAISEHLTWLIGQVPALARENCAEEMRRSLETCLELARKQESELAAANAIIVDACLRKAEAEGGLN